MASYGLPTNLDQTYADDGTDPSVKAHQQMHDTVHGFVNRFDTAAGTALDVWAVDPASGLFVPTSLSSKYVPTVDFEVTTGGNYTFVLADRGKLKGSTAADSTALTYTIPANATVPFPVGTAIEVMQRGTGQITITAAAGVTLKAPGSAYKTSAQNASVLLVQLFADIWWVKGGIA